MRSTIWKVAVATSVEAADAVAELLSSHCDQPPVTYIDAQTQAASVAVYSVEEPLRSDAKRAALRAGLRHLGSCGLRVNPARISVRKIRRENWAESWKRHFKPIEIGDALLIRPSWSRRQSSKGQCVVVLDPGLSFGTGQHPTTAFCLRQIVALRRPDCSQAFLDLGTGSGILAIAAARVGYAPVVAMDCDAEAVRAARANARANGVSRRICVERQDLARLPVRPTRPYDVICANLTADLLLTERRRIVGQLRPAPAGLQDGGALVLAGILHAEFGPIRKAYESLGLRLAADASETGWRSGCFVFRQPKSRCCAGQ